MKAVGIVRRMDALGRMCIPQELCRAMCLSKGDAVEFFTDGENVVIRKYDTLGDLEQILDNTESSIRLQNGLVPETASAMLSKVEEMRAILEKARQK